MTVARNAIGPRVDDSGADQQIEPLQNGTITSENTLGTADVGSDLELTPRRLAALETLVMLSGAALARMTADDLRGASRMVRAMTKVITSELAPQAGGIDR